MVRTPRSARVPRLDTEVLLRTAVSCSGQRTGTSSMARTRRLKAAGRGRSPGAHAEKTLSLWWPGSERSRARERGASMALCRGGRFACRLVPSGSGSGVRRAGSGRGCAGEALPGAAAVVLRCRAAVAVVRVVRWSVVLVLVMAAERRCRLGPMNRAAGRSLRWCLPVVPVGLPHRLFLRWSFCCDGSAAKGLVRFSRAGFLAVAAFVAAAVTAAVTAGGASSSRTAVATAASGEC